MCGDILDAARLTEVIRQYKPAAVIHFAALAHVGESVTDPAKYFRNNVSGSLTLFETVVMLSSLAMVRIPAVCSAKFVRLRAT